MKKLSPFAKVFLVVVALLGDLGLGHAQTLEYLDVNNVKAGFGVGGNLFTTTTPTSIWDLLETPAGSGKREIYTAALWMTGTDPGGNLHCAAQRYFDYGNDYFDGPVAAVYNNNYDNYYNRVFKVSQLQIVHFMALNFPVQALQVDSAIKYWPGKGNPSVLRDYGVSIDSPLAPFVDLNNNGIYEPLLGEYPAVVGDQNIFFVFNDIRSAHTESNGAAFGVEIRGMASSFLDYNYNLASYNSPINNTIYVQYEIQNKSHVVYNNYNLGLYVDPDLGCFNNDFVGCDTDRGMMFVYNGTATDPDCAPETGYGSSHVALGIQMLNRPMSVFGYFTSNGEPIGVGFVETAPYYANYLNGFWGDGTPFEFGGSGYNTGGAPTKFLLSGDPTDLNGWSEAQNHHVPGDRRMFGSTGPSSFLPGEIKHFDLGFTTAYHDGSDQFSIVDSLKKSADVVRQFYSYAIIPAQQALGIPEVSGNQLTVSIYPNPAKNEVTIEAGDYIRSIELMDIQGRVLLSKEANAKKTVLPVTNLARGIYLVHVQSAGGSVIKRVVVE